MMGHLVMFPTGLEILPSLKRTAKAPENQWLEDGFPFGMAYFQGRTVSFGEGRFVYIYLSVNWHSNGNSPCLIGEPSPSVIFIRLSVFRGVFIYTPWNYLKIGHHKRKLVFQPSIFRYENVSFREGRYWCFLWTHVICILDVPLGSPPHIQKQWCWNYIKFLSSYHPFF